MPSKTVTLTTPIVSSGTPPGKIESLQFREPRFEDYMTLGDPRVPVIVGERFVFQPVPSLIKDYAERLLVGCDVNVMASASLRDSIEIQETILSFFTALDPQMKSGDLDANSSSSSEKTSAGSPA